MSVAGSCHCGRIRLRVARPALMASDPMRIRIRENLCEGPTVVHDHGATSAQQTIELLSAGAALQEIAQRAGIELDLGGRRHRGSRGRAGELRRHRRSRCAGRRAISLPRLARVASLSEGKKLIRRHGCSKSSPDLAFDDPADPDDARSSRRGFSPRPHSRPKTPCLGRKTASRPSASDRAGDPDAHRMTATFASDR